MLSDIICVIVNCIAQRPADSDHPYGHGRVEMIGSIGVSLMLIAAGGMVCVESIEKMKNPESKPLEWLSSPSL